MLKTSYSKAEDTLTVRPAGRLDTATSPELQKDIQPHLEGIKHVIMDFKALEYISSAGLRLLIQVAQQMKERDGIVEVIHANEYILDVFKLAGLDEVVKVVPKE